MARLLPLIALMAGCAFGTVETGREFPLAKVERLEGLTVGETTMEDAGALLGKPVKIEKRDDGSSDLTWALIITRSRAVSLPLVTVGWGESEITAATLRFRDGLLEDVVKTVDARVSDDVPGSDESRRSVTIWLPEDVYRHLKNRAVGTTETPSLIAERVLRRWAGAE